MYSLISMAADRNQHVLTLTTPAVRSGSTEQSHHCNSCQPTHRESDSSLNYSSDPLIITAARLSSFILYWIKWTDQSFIHLTAQSDNEKGKESVFCSIMLAESQIWHILQPSLKLLRTWWRKYSFQTTFFTGH